jgi:hypothetical protein
MSLYVLLGLIVFVATYVTVTTTNNNNNNSNGNGNGGTGDSATSTATADTTRYWDCCKPSCAWTGNVAGAEVCIYMCLFVSCTHARVCMYVCMYVCMSYLFPTLSISGSLPFRLTSVHPSNHRSISLNPSIHHPFDHLHTPTTTKTNRI